MTALAGTFESLRTLGERRAQYQRFVLRVFASTSARIGGVLVVAVICLGLFGPFVAPHDPDTFLTAPFSPAGSHGLLLGGDYLGRDALSRFLWGGRMMLFMVVLSLVGVYAAGLGLGLLAAYKRGLADLAISGILDVALAFPPLIFVLVLIAALGSHWWLVVVGVICIFAPRVARITRGAALDIVVQEFVEAAVARGETTAFILRREVLPNLWPPILADMGVRATWLVILIASLGFLGFGEQPPSADWGTLISENSGGLSIQPWPVVAPLCVLALLTVGINLVADGLIQALATSGEVDESEVVGGLI